MSRLRLPQYLELLNELIGNAPPDTAVEPARPAHRILRVYHLLVHQPAALSHGIFDTLDASPLSMLARQVAGESLARPELCSQARAAFDAVVQHQQPSGALLAPDPAFNPESRWYEELITLHALASYAVRVRSDAVDRAVRLNAEYQLEQLQPDHATAEPWALLAFLQHAPPLADQMLHALQMQYAGRIPGIPLLLLIDARYGLRRYLLSH